MAAHWLPNSFSSRVPMQMKHLVHDLPVAVNFQKREQVGKTKTGPVFKLKSHRCDGSNNIDASDSCPETGRWTVLVIPSKELLDGAAEQIGTDSRGD